MILIDIKVCQKVKALSPERPGVFFQKGEYS